MMVAVVCPCGPPKSGLHDWSMVLVDGWQFIRFTCRGCEEWNWRSYIFRHDCRCLKCLESMSSILVLFKVIFG
jgi:hypothetical protein